MDGLTSLFSMNTLISLLYYIVMGVILYIITGRYKYVVNVIIYGIIKTVPDFFLLSEVTFKVILINLLISLIVVYVAQTSRERLYYDSILWYMLIVIVTQVISVAVITKVVALF